MDTIIKRNYSLKLEQYTKIRIKLNGNYRYKYKRRQFVGGGFSNDWYTVDRKTGKRIDNARLCDLFTIEELKNIRFEGVKSFLLT